ncbi:MAG: hypothetical protein WED10_11745, partial [Brumimicrobium sp.]
MKNIILSTILLLTSMTYLNGQCENTTSYGSASAPTNNTPVTISTCSYQTEFSTISNVVSGETYEVDSDCGGYITVRSGTPDGPVVNSGNAPLSFTATSNDDHYIHWNTDSGCGNATDCCETTITCTSCSSSGGGGCLNTSSFGSASAPTSNITETISSCNYQTEYSTISNVVAGETYEVNSDCGGYITVRSGSYNGPIVEEGNAPLSWTATSNDNHYIHWNTDSGCGTASNCCETTITCTSCPAPVPPANDDCSSSFSVSVNTDGTCNSTTAGSIENATASSQSTTACNGTENDDIWFSFVAPASGSIELNLQNITGSTTDLYHSVWEGSCPSLTHVAGSCSDPNTSSLTGLNPGQTYYVRVYSWSSTSGQNSSFDLCITEAGPCGNPENNDYCSNPATLTQGGTDWSSSTTDTYSADSPANTSQFCGSIENNSWYVFTAQSTTETFEFSSVTNCNDDWGIQAEVFEITTDANGCCTDLTSMSNCWNPGTATTGTVTASGLTVGNDYYLMVDGWGGDNCDFTVDGWGATGILPVDLLSFTGNKYNDINELWWTTATEENNDYFIIEHSIDGENWVKIDQINGAGNSSSEITYNT